MLFRHLAEAGGGCRNDAHEVVRGIVPFLDQGYHFLRCTGVTRVGRDAVFVIRPAGELGIHDIERIGKLKDLVRREVHLPGFYFCNRRPAGVAGFLGKLLL